MRLHSTFRNLTHYCHGAIAKQKLTTFTFCLWSFLACNIVIHPALAASSADNKKGKTFSHDTVVTLAEQLAQKPFKEAKKAPKELTDLDFVTYGKINYQEDAAIWGGEVPQSFQSNYLPQVFYTKTL